jgi:Spy/CpxP family protein refolding chaperone
MRRLVLLWLMCAAWLLQAAPQNTAALPWWTSSVVGDLGLTQEQQRHIRQIIRSYRDRLFDARNAAQKAQAEVQDLLNEPTVNPAAAKPAIERLAQARAESTRLFTQMSVELRSVLTLDQWRELVKRWADVQRTKGRSDTATAP